MKTYFSKILSFTFVLGIAVSCTDYLDKAPQSTINEGDAYKNYRNFQGFVEELYNAIPLLSASEMHNSWNIGEDEMWELNETRLFAYHVDQGNYWAWESAYYCVFRTGGNATGDRYQRRYYTNSWYAIRKANVGLANLDKMIDGTDEEKNLIAGQLYFFRGFFHFLLMQYWGGLPYIDEALPADYVFKLPRLSYHETADKAAADFRKAADLLPLDWDQTTPGRTTLGKNNMRINKVMALSFLGKNLLWAGSPLMNQASTGSSSYHTDYCKKAADVFAEVLQICESTGRYELANFSEYSRLFYTYNQGGVLPGLREAIFYESLADAGNRFRWNQINDYAPQTLIASGIKVWPTANYVNYYGMANGLPIVNPEQKDAESGYDPEYPWKDRDPRFYHDIKFDGIMCVRDGSRVGNNKERQYASLYTGGFYRDDSGNKRALTGYMMGKFVSQYLNQWDGYQDGNVMVLSMIRLADVYLMYAEATAQGYGTPQSKSGSYGLSALDAVNKIRTRAGVDPIADKFTGDNQSFMSELRRERAVELAFEGHRFVDLRRWLLLTERPYTLKTAVQFDRGSSDNEVFANPRNARVLNLRHEVLVERQLQQKHYWFPFLRNDVNLYKEFQQNPGW